MKQRSIIFISIGVVFCFYFIMTLATLKNLNTPYLNYFVQQIYPHSLKAFTEGLILQRGKLYESTGLYGQSKLSILNLSTGQAIKTVNLPKQYFGEGIAIIGERLFQLTYHAQLGFIYNKHTLKLIKQFHYVGEGWGLTTDGHVLIMSNGSAKLQFINPHNFSVLKVLTVQKHHRLITGLNSLAYVHGKIFANVWQTPLIAVISAQTGDVLSWINLKKLQPALSAFNSDAVLNGIAYDRQRHNF